MFYHKSALRVLRVKHKQVAKLVNYMNRIYCILIDFSTEQYIYAKKETDILIRFQFYESI